MKLKACAYDDKALWDKGRNFITSIYRIMPLVHLEILFWMKRNIFFIFKGIQK